jgi:hypothetical protein
MSSGVRFALFAGLVVVSGAALAEDSTPLCADVAGPKAVVAAHHGSWTELSADQWQFMRGIYAMNPLTPDGLPYGDRAALAQFEGIGGGIVFFIDGDKACTPMAVPNELLAMMDDVATAKISHEGSAL